MKYEMEAKDCLENTAGIDDLESKSYWVSRAQAWSLLAVAEQLRLLREGK